MKACELLVPINGFKASGVQCGVKKKRKDLGLIYCEKGAIAAGVFTQNASMAAPVIKSIENIKGEKIKALLINSGNANAFTGEEGMNNCDQKISYLASKLGVAEGEILLSSTGIIGKQLEMEKLIYGINDCVSTLSQMGIYDVPEAILTTDTTEKVFTVRYMDADDKAITLTGLAKGSGMIHPNMATMLCFVLTDAVIEKGLLQQLVTEVAEDTFNMISVDGDTSTNDMALVLSSCAAENELMQDPTSENALLFKEALHQAYKSLAIQIASDGEGATKLMAVHVKQAQCKKSARKLAKTVVSSSLVKTAIFGSDANWGRVVCALGYAESPFDPSKVDLSFSSSKGDVQVVKNGQPIPYDDVYAKSVLEDVSVEVNISLNMGAFEATAWGCDLTYDYVKINGAYST